MTNDKFLSALKYKFHEFEARPHFLFILEEFPEGNRGISASDLYSRYEQWCSSNDHQPTTNTRFTKDIKKVQGLINSFRRSAGITHKITNPSLIDWVAYFENIANPAPVNDDLGERGVTMDDWFGWYLDVKNWTLDYFTPRCSSAEPFYWIGLFRLNSSANILGFVAQLAHKNEDVYGKAPHLGLFNAIDQIFDLQANCCSYGKEKTFDPIKLTKTFCDENNINYKKKRKSISAGKRYKIFKKDSFRCVMCGVSAKTDDVKLHVDHICPVSKGGDDCLDNLQTLCERCNLGKSDDFDQ
jgi:hypothetical protein